MLDRSNYRLNAIIERYILVKTKQSMCIVPVMTVVKTAQKPKNTTIQRFTEHFTGMLLIQCFLRLV